MLTRCACFSCRAEACGRDSSVLEFIQFPEVGFVVVGIGLHFEGPSPLREGLFDAFKRQSCDFGFKIMRALDVDTETVLLEDRCTLLPEDTENNNG